MKSTNKNIFSRVVLLLSIMFLFVSGFLLGWKKSYASTELVTNLESSSNICISSSGSGYGPASAIVDKSATYILSSPSDLQLR